MNDFEDLGQQIQNMVQRAVNSRDFEELSRNIADTADIALREIGRGLDRASDALHGRRGNDTWDEAGRSARKEESGDSTGRSAWTSQRYEYSSRQTQSRTRYEYSYSSRQTEKSVPATAAANFRENRGTQLSSTPPGGGSPRRSV
ncbi:MAG: hypothetical protein LUE63_03895 [Lachnospiraceae bacterium]|nr:hypothetical protein [Lachnospiraceae bacterium]